MRLLVCLAARARCLSTRKPTKPEPGELPPLPPASGTAVGYLVDAQASSSCATISSTKLKQIDASLAAENGQIDAQLRQIEKPVPEEELTPQQQKAGEKPPRYNNAPGASTITTNDSQKLRKLRDENDQRRAEEGVRVARPEQQRREGQAHPRGPRRRRPRRAEAGSRARAARTTARRMPGMEPVT